MSSFFVDSVAKEKSGAVEEEEKLKEDPPPMGVVKLKVEVEEEAVEDEAGSSTGGIFIAGSAAWPLRLTVTILINV